MPNYNLQMGLYMVNKIPLIRQLPYSVAFSFPEYCAMGGEAIMTGELEPYYVYIDVHGTLPPHINTHPSSTCSGPPFLTQAILDSHSTPGKTIKITNRY